MRTSTLLRNLRTRWTALASGRDGNVAVMFALAIVPIVGLVGAAVDFSRANAAKAAMQSALDSTILMLSKEAPGLTQDQLNQKAKDYFNALFTRQGVSNVNVKNVTYTTSGGSKLSIEVTGAIDSNFMGIIGRPQM